MGVEARHAVTYRAGVKPSPVPSILLLIAAAILAFSLLGRGWTTHDSESVTVKSGPLWGEVCIDMGDGMECKTHTVFSNLGKNINGFAILGLLFIACALGGMITSAIAGFLLLSKPRTALAMVSLILMSVATLIMLAIFLYGFSKGGGDLPGYGFFLYFVGATLVIVGSILGMSSKRGGAPAHPRPGYPPAYGYAPPGYPPPAYNHTPGYNQVPGYPPPGYQAGPGYAPPGYPPANQPPGYPQPVPTAPLGAADYAAAPSPQAPQAPQAPMHSCGLPMAWDPRNQRWGCQRCGE